MADGAGGLGGMGGLSGMGGLMPLAIGSATGLLSATGSWLSGWGAQRGAARQRRRTRALLAWAGQQAERKTRLITQGRPYRLAERYYLGAFEKGVPDVLAADVAARMRTAGAARGMEYGAQPAIAESVALTRMAEERRRELAPSLLQLAQLPFQIEQSAFDYYLNRSGLRYGTASVGPTPLELAGSALASGVEGFLGGLMAAGGMGGGGGGGAAAKAAGGGGLGWLGGLF